MGPPQVEGAVREWLHVSVEVDQPRQCASEGRVIVDGHLVVGCAAPAARVLEPAHPQEREIFLACEMHRGLSNIACSRCANVRSGHQAVPGKLALDSCSIIIFILWQVILTE